MQLSNALPIAAGLLLLWSGDVAGAEPETVALACKGTLEMPAEKVKMPTSMGIIVDFSTRMVQGFGRPVPLRTNDTTVSFEGTEDYNLTTRLTISGSIDRVTGDVWAVWTMIEKNGNAQTARYYKLQCRPTERMF
jgi:hypothetical protein